ncbi:MAG TPA: SufD family Fe-S cluster assembly protein [Candidatus Limnocylindria bacterium]|nr:SufD family Fe-S cluster assembly protein [Candidatus Limnocylindria bacterium]
MALATAPTALLPLDRTEVERLSRRRGEPDWLRDWRLEALASLRPEDWPTGAEEEWRRFPLQGLPTGPLVVDEPPGPPSEYSAIPVGAAHKGVVFDRWTDAVTAHPDLVRKALGTNAGLKSHAAFRALNAAAFAHGSTFVYVPAGVHVELPLHVQKHWAAGSGAIIFRTVVVAERGSGVTVVEEVTSAGGGKGRVAIPGVEIIAGEGAQVRYVGIQRFGNDVWDLGFQRYASGRDSTIASFNVLVGSHKTKLGIVSDILGDRATVKLYGLVAASADQRIDVNSLQRLDGKASTSDLLYLSALYERAHATYYGIIRVEPTSSASGSYQECRNMLLSDKAGADPIPVLEILTNDVARCGHGATAGRLDDLELFYVMSRGLDRASAEQLLVRGFFQRVINQIPDPQVGARILAALAPRIGRLAELEDAA